LDEDLARSVEEINPLRNPVSNHTWHRFDRIDGA